MVMSRRRALAVLASVALAGCSRVQPRDTPPPLPPTPAEFTHWHTEARGIISDAFETLQTFETFAAFRVSKNERSDRRAATDLAWDPPTRDAWRTPSMLHARCTAAPINSSRECRPRR